MGSAIITNQKEKIRELIDSAESIGIVVGENHNVDLMAAALGLSLALSQNGKNVQVVSRKEPIVEFSNLVGIDRLLKSFAGSTKVLTISVPYREGEIEKVSYNIEEDKLNVNLFAESSGITFDESKIEYIKKGSSPAVLILIGVSNEKELNGLVDARSVKTIVIDKNPLNALPGDIQIVDPLFSSFSEIATGIIIEASLGYDIDAFQNLMDGISYATRNFTRQDTSPYAFEAAGFLLQNGARRETRSKARPNFDDRFPKEEYLLGQRPPAKLGQPMAEKFQKSIPQPSISNQTTQPNPDFGSSVQPQASAPQETPTTEDSQPRDIPDEWFLPKVFKGSRKGN